MFKAMTKIINIHRKKTPNIGDLVSAPAKYFQSTRNGVYIDILDCENPDDHTFRLLDSADFLIIGGGGLLEHPKFEKSLLNLINLYPDKCVIWGAGKNSVGNNISADVISNLEHIGVRDYNTKHKWVPCASCLNPYLLKTKLNKKMIYKGGVGIVENNSGQNIKAISDFDIENVRRIGNKKTKDIEMFEFILSCDLVVTSSFHAAYWATLLEIPVIGVPTSIKFQTFRHSIPLASNGNWISQLGNTKVYESALNECIEANINFIKSLPDKLKKELIGY